MGDLFDHVIAIPVNVGNNFYSLAVAPLTRSLLPFLRRQFALSVLLTLAPLALIYFAVGPHVGAATVLLVVHILPLVSSPVGPHEDSIAVHHVILELAGIAPAIAHFDLALPFDGVVTPVALVHGVVRPLIDSIALLLAVYKRPLENDSLFDGLFPLAVFLVVFELAVVGQNASLVEELAVPTKLAALEFALVDIPVGVIEGARTGRFAVSPLALVSRAVLVDLGSVAMFYLKILRTLVLLDISRIEGSVWLSQVLDECYGVLLVVQLVIHAQARHVFDVPSW